MAHAIIAALRAEIIPEIKGQRVSHGRSRRGGPAVRRIPPHNTTPRLPHAGQRGDPGKWGAADPRVAYRDADGTYFLTWDNCTKNCYPHRTTWRAGRTQPRAIFCNLLRTRARASLML